MAKDDKGTVVVEGDRVTIGSQGMRVTGTAIYADWSRLSDGGWDIEMMECDICGGYSHWKQYYDKGRIVSVNGVEVGA